MAYALHAYVVVLGRETVRYRFITETSSLILQFVREVRWQDVGGWGFFPSEAFLAPDNGGGFTFMAVAVQHG